MALVKEMQIGKTKIEIHSNITEEEKKKNLIEAYKTINKIADKQREKGNNVDDWFYTQQELNQIKKSGNYILM